MKYEIIRTKERLKEYLTTCEDAVAFDVETTGLSIDCTLLCISLYDNKNTAVCIPTDFFFKKCLPLQDIRDCFKHHSIKYGIAHNGKFDVTIFKENKIKEIPLTWDTLLMCHNYDTNIEKKLEKRVKEDLGITKKSFEEIIGKKWDRIDWVKDIKSGDITLEQLAKYACEDVVYTYQLRDYYLPLLEDEGLLQVHNKIELPLVSVLSKMYRVGVRIDKDMLYKMGVEVVTYQQGLMSKIYEEAGAVFNINSGKQKAEILFDKLDLNSSKKTKGGARSTDSAVLEKLALEGHQIAAYMVEYSEMQKLYSGYIRAIPGMVDDDGRLRCNFNSAGTKTGRFSSDKPNLQNQPNNERFPVRSAFIPAEDCVFIDFDYSQIELRVMAFVSKDEKFMDAFQKGEDIHGRVASDLGITRDQAKTVNFGILYGMGYQSLALLLGVSEARAKSIITNYERTYSGYYNWKVRTEASAKKNGYIKTIFGRIRRMPALEGGMSREYFGALRQSINTVIQGSAADIIKLAMVAIAKRFNEENLQANILLQVHDELLIECNKNCVETVYNLVKETMETTTILKGVPLEADGKVINNWGQMKDKKFESLLNNYKNNDLLWLLQP